MTERPLRVLRSLFRTSLLAAVGLLSAGAIHAAVISPGTPTVSVPASLADPFNSLAGGLQPGQFLLPIEIAGASGLQSWSFDLLFNDAVVTPLDAGGAYQWVYQAGFSATDPTVSDITSSGVLAVPPGGLLDTIAGQSYGVSGDGLLAFVLFEYVQGQETINPGFHIDNPTVQQAPEPGTMMLLAGALLTLAWTRRRHGGLPIARLQ